MKSVLLIILSAALLAGCKVEPIKQEEKTREQVFSDCMHTVHITVVNAHAEHVPDMAAAVTACKDAASVVAGKEAQNESDTVLK